MIQHAVWLYFRLNLGRRDIEDLLAQRQIIVSHELSILQTAFLCVLEKCSGSVDFTSVGHSEPWTVNLAIPYSSCLIVCGCLIIFNNFKLNVIDMR